MSTILKSEHPSNEPVLRRMQKSSTVLVLDTLKEQRDLVYGWLNSPQTDVLLCSRVSAVEEHFSRGEVDLLVLDYELDEGHALDLIPRLENRLGRKIPFIIVTSSGTEEIAVEAMKQGACDYLVKDNRLEERLRAAVEAELENVRAHRILGSLDGELSQSERRAERILDTVAEAFFSIDEDGTIIDWNRSATELFGYQTREIIGRNIIETIVPERYREQVSNGLRQFRETHQLNESLRNFETTGLTKEGREVPITLSLNIVPLGTTSIISGFARDISRRCELKPQLIHSEKMASLGQLAAGVAHEINNPVGFVTSNVTTLEEYITVFKQVIALQEDILQSFESSDDPTVRSRLEKIAEYKRDEDYDYLRNDIDDLIKESNEGLVRVKEIVQNLKTFARADDTETREADVNDCLTATIKVVWNEIKYHCELVENFGSIPKLRCYPGQLNHVFMNLLVNAAHAITERGTITVTTEADDDHVIVKVQDNGHGIEPEHLPNLFTPFFTTKPVGKGTGLGLSIAYGIVEKHQGSIDVESEVGVGTTFTVKLPRAGVES